MVTYITFLDKNNKLRPIMCIDMTDEKCIMIVTVTVPTQLIQFNKQKLIAGNNIHITNFKIMLKTNYDRGDCDHIRSFNETILRICNEYTFIPNRTVKQFSENTYRYPDHYPVGKMRPC